MQLEPNAVYMFQLCNKYDHLRLGRPFRKIKNFQLELMRSVEWDAKWHDCSMTKYPLVRLQIYFLVKTSAVQGSSFFFPRLRARPSGWIISDRWTSVHISFFKFLILPLWHCDERVLFKFKVRVRGSKTSYTTSCEYVAHVALNCNVFSVSQNQLKLENISATS